MGLFDGLAGIASGIFGLTEDNPADAAGEYLDKIPETLKPYYQPYIDAGLKAMGIGEEEYSKLISDPSAMYNKIAQGYQESPGFAFEEDQAMRGIQNAAAAGGMTGTPEHQQMAGQMAQNLASKDFNNYLSRALGLYGQGLSGMSGITGLGYQASSGLADNLASALISQSQAAYAGQQGQNQAMGGGIGDLFGGVGDILGGLF